MTTDLKQILLKIEDALQSNPECSGNLLLPNRIFCCEKDGRSEILVSLNNKMQRPHYWGHIFWQDGRYISLIVAVDYWLNPTSEKQLFEEFWQNLSQEGKWYPIAGDVFEVKEEFHEACQSLARMISNFASLKAQADFDVRVIQVYPFPNPFKELAN